MVTGLIDAELMGLPDSERWVSTFTPALARRAEAAMEEGRLVRNFQYAVPASWARQHAERNVVWQYPARVPANLLGEPFFLE